MVGDSDCGVLGTLMLQLSVYGGVRAEHRRVVCLVHIVGVKTLATGARIANVEVRVLGINASSASG